MCLTLEVPTQRKLNKSKIYFKILTGLSVTHDRRCGVTHRLCSPMQRTLWRKGWNHSSRHRTTLTRREQDTNQVRHGFHVFLRKKDAEEALKTRYFDDLSDVVIRVKGYPEHFVTRGQWIISDLLNNQKRLPSAVLTKVFLSKKAYDQAIKRYLEL